MCWNYFQCSVLRNTFFSLIVSFILSEPKLRLFYQLHPSPQTAADNDHTSTFSLHLEMSDSQTPLEKSWKAFFKSILLLPG